MSEKLIVKYGGHADQLSQAHYAMDRFRVYALNKLLQSATELLPEKHEAARQMLMRKAGVVYRGAVKHENAELACTMERYLKRWDREALNHVSVPEEKSLFKRSE